MTRDRARRAPLIFALGLTLAPLASGQSQPTGTPGTNTLAYCSGEYADDFSSLAPKTREFDKAPYLYLV